MILKVGVAMMTLALVLAGVVASVAIRAEEPAPALAQAERSVPAEVLELERRYVPRPDREESQEKSREGLQEESRGEPQEEKREEPAARALPVSDTDLPEPSGAEVAAANVPRRYPPQQSAVLTLSIPAIGLYDVPIADSSSSAALDRGVIHLPETPMPWEKREQKNVYLAGHRVGYPGTGSRLVFYNLDKLKTGDAIKLRDRSGRVYEYRVTEAFEVAPDASWAMDSVRDRDIVTLQTCTPIPTYERRLVVRADRLKTAALG